MTDAVYVLYPLVMTVVLECTAAWIIGIRNRHDQFLIVLVNAVTNPLLVLFSSILMYNTGIKHGYLLTLTVLEPLVIYAEYRLYRMYLNPGHREFLLSFGLNLISILGGILWLVIR